MKTLKALLLGTALLAPSLLAPSLPGQPGAALAAATRANAAAKVTAPGPYQHVLLLNIDGLHTIDLQNWLRTQPGSALASLAAEGTQFTSAYAATPTNGFPGMLAIATGGSAGDTGVFYDDSYDRNLYPPGSNCSGNAGTEVNYTQAIDKNTAGLAAGGTLGQPLTQISPAALPLSLTGSTCAPVYPHQFIRTNTIFEAIHAGLPGARTAWADDHPSYDILNGNSGTGVDDLYTPELNSTDASEQNIDHTGAYSSAQRYDQNKVGALLNEISGKSSTGTGGAGVPVLFGMNFKSVEIGQRLASSGPGDQAGLLGGYSSNTKLPVATPNNGLAGQLSFVDGQIGQILSALNTANLAGSTLVIVTARYADNPVNPKAIIRVDPNQPTKGFPATIDHFYPNQSNVFFAAYGDVAVIWLNPTVRNANVPAYHSLTYNLIERHALSLHIDADLTNNDMRTDYGLDPFKDNRAPDIIVVPWPGVLYTTSKELADHGNIWTDDMNVALMVSAQGLTPGTIEDAVGTEQIAPTIMDALGLKPSLLKAVVAEGTVPLPVSLQ